MDPSNPEVSQRVQVAWSNRPLFVDNKICGVNHTSIPAGQTQKQGQGQDTPQTLCWLMNLTQQPKTASICLNWKNRWQIRKFLMTGRQIA